MVVERRFKAGEKNEQVKRGNRQKQWRIGTVSDYLYEKKNVYGGRGEKGASLKGETKT